MMNEECLICKAPLEYLEKDDETVILSYAWTRASCDGRVCTADRIQKCRRNCRS